MQNEQELNKKQLDIIYNLMYIYKKSHKIKSKDAYILLLESKLTKLFNTIE